MSSLAALLGLIIIGVFHGMAAIRRDIIAERRPKRRMKCGPWKWEN